MIVISGALVLVALVLLVLGLTMTDLDFVYGSIAVSLVSFVFLVIGILQRRGEQPATAGGPPVTADAAEEKDAAEPAVSVSKPAAARTAAAPARAGSVVLDDVADDEEELEPGGGPVLIVPGRPRYHVEGCRYLTGKEVEEIDVLDARDDGFTACGVCKPDEVLEELYGPYDDDDSGGPGTEDDVEEPAPAPVPAAKPAKAAAAKRAPAAKAAAVALVEPAPAKAASSRTKVVVIPDRGRFHTSSCRFVRDALGTEELTRTQATKQGYQACGVCKP